MTDKPTEATVELIMDAIAGDFVWVFDENANNYVDGVYMGRGAWSLREIEYENRSSFTVSGSKFDRKTGIARAQGNYTPMMRLYGQNEYEGKLWKDKNQHKLIQFIERNVRDIDILKRIAALVGYIEEK